MRRWPPGSDPLRLPHFWKKWGREECGVPKKWGREETAELAVQKWVREEYCPKNGGEKKEPPRGKWGVVVGFWGFGMAANPTRI
jgi:hypothetical protein